MTWPVKHFEPASALDSVAALLLPEEDRPGFETVMASAAVEAAGEKLSEFAGTGGTLPEFSINVDCECHTDEHGTTGLLWTARIVEGGENSEGGG